ncbi:MAG: GntR family transcriptional regulator [Ruminococcaceae bacterium]|nr:GntR family transcriptional regulator [Oscillospiraceae bacterium]
MAKVEFDNSQPIYQQLMDVWRRKIVSGRWQLGERVPSVRDLAAEYGVNPNTVQRALAELEREELLFSNRTVGRLVTTDENLLLQVREQLAKALIKQFVTEARGLQLNDNQLLKQVAAALEAKEEA